MFKCLCLPRDSVSCLLGPGVALFMGSASLPLLEETGLIIFEVPNSGIGSLVLIIIAFICVLLGASPTTAEVQDGSDACLHLLCSMCFYFLERNFALSIDFAYIYVAVYLFVHGLNVIIYLTRVFPVLSAFLSCFTWVLC